MNKSWLLGGALLLSLAGNAFLGGWLLGKPAHFAPMHPGAEGPRLQHMLARMQQLPEQQRQQIREKMREHAPQMRALADQGREQRQLIEQLMGQAELPRSELQAAFARQRELQAQMQELNQRMLLEIAGLLPAEQRVELLRAGPHGAGR
ncbi:periplasmic heavy metal sensor [Pseudomonas sp. N040]|uniref:periplasmic heavy metal sensor n=1 Tax=Pseudomonas sp. N040 TaxID=2785325 RepID=UPI0018A2ECAF|nr:periplasmic heavy metal sensor [Pseudomonas sp. N040]MBF7731074.1 periplasmic heavy metal sensor [Pseudomonas sp. N040]MBW7014717.1 periplasmic heavy metal sensor [Pseudomonas sp. N040]